MTKQNHITLLGVLHIARGAFVLLVGVLLFAVLTGIGAISEDSTALGVLGFIGTALMLILSALAVPSILAGIGILLRREWGRILALVVGILSLIDIPIGTAIGVYSIWVLMNDETRMLFTNTPTTIMQTPAPAPQI
jgi:hypothetical protein